MLFESMRHALHVLREIAELNVAAKVRTYIREGDGKGRRVFGGSEFPNCDFVELYEVHNNH